jgi:DNA-directed RNA polymerase specialized sigma24 family protein
MAVYYEWVVQYQGSIPYEGEWPLGVPSNFEELHREYGGFVASRVRRYNKVERNFEDLLQEVWAHLIHVDLLEKFKKSGMGKLPLTMTANEACSFLGITFPQWVRVLENNDFVSHLDGSRFSEEAVFLTEDVVNLDNCFSPEWGGNQSPWVNRGKRTRPRMTAKGFKAYLERAVSNAFKNFCRTKDRRHKDHPISPSSHLAPTSAGEYRRSVNLENQSSWEDGIAAAMTLDQEDAIDLARQIRKASIDPESNDGAEILDLLLHQGRSRHDGPQRNIDTIILLGQGYSLSDAVKKARARSRDRVKRQQQAVLG